MQRIFLLKFLYYQLMRTLLLREHVNLGSKRRAKLGTDALG
jgi:hypothetical protein